MCARAGSLFLFQVLSGAGLARAKAPAPSAITYRDITYASCAADILQLATARPDLASLSTTQALYGLRTVGTCRNADGSRTTCQNYVLEITNRSSAAADPARPEILISGALHGDERVGPATALALARWLVLRYDVDPWVRRLVDTRVVIIMPMTNAIGVEANSRAEMGIDPNRDFPYDQTPAACMQTVAARSINELYRARLLQLVITFHGGMQAIGYNWGSFNYRTGKPHRSPDDASQVGMVGAMSSFAGTGHVPGQRDYPSAPMNDIVYPVHGGMEDWGYAASWDRAFVTPCKPRSDRGPYSESRTQYNDAQVRAFTVLVETSDSKRPRAETYGTEAGVYSPELGAPADGHVPRNLRLSLAAVDLLQPFVELWAGAEPGRAGGVRSGRVGGLAGAGGPAIAARADDCLEISWSVWGARRVAATFPACRRVVTSGRAREWSTCGQAQSGAGVWGAGSSPFEPHVFTACVSLAEWARASELEVAVAAEADPEWGQPPKVAYAPHLDPQSHLARARTQGYKAENNGHEVRGQSRWFSSPLRVRLTTPGPAPAAVVGLPPPPPPRVSELGAASGFVGLYLDSHHLRGSRSISAASCSAQPPSPCAASHVTITLRDEPAGAASSVSGRTGGTLTGVQKGKLVSDGVFLEGMGGEPQVVLADFSPKGGPASLLGTLTPGGVRWADGNVWGRLSEDKAIEWARTVSAAGPSRALCEEAERLLPGVLTCRASPPPPPPPPPGATSAAEPAAARVPARPAAAAHDAALAACAAAKPQPGATALIGPFGPPVLLCLPLASGRAALAPGDGLAASVAAALSSALGLGPGAIVPYSLAERSLAEPAVAAGAPSADPSPKPSDRTVLLILVSPPASATALSAETIALQAFAQLRAATKHPASRAAALAAINREADGASKVTGSPISGGTWSANAVSQLRTVATTAAALEAAALAGREGAAGLVAAMAIPVLLCLCCVGACCARRRRQLRRQQARAVAREVALTAHSDALDGDAALDERRKRYVRHTVQAEQACLLGGSRSANGSSASESEHQMSELGLAGVGASVLQSERPRECARI